MTAHTNFPARFAIGDTVMFAPTPEGSLAEGQWLSPAEVTQVSFTGSKVLYDLQLKGLSGNPYGAPLQRVDSCFVHGTDPKE